MKIKCEYKTLTLLRPTMFTKTYKEKPIVFGKNEHCALVICMSLSFLNSFTAYEASFLVQNNNEKQCIYHGKTTFVRRYSTCIKKTGNSRWMWTNYGQFLNWQTLECMTDDYYTPDIKTHFATMTKCDRHDQKQLWECEGDKKYNIKQTQSGRTLYYGEYYNYLTTKDTTHTTPTTWTRLGSEKDVCSQGSLLS